MQKVDLSWQRVAKCRGEDTSLFFPSGKEPVARDEVRAICKGCPARLACLTHALRFREPGIWAGTTTQERRTLRGKRCNYCGSRIDARELARHHLQRALEWRCRGCGGVGAVRKAQDPEAAQRAREAALRWKRRWVPPHLRS